MIATISTIPIAVDDASKLGFLGLSISRCADMLPHHYAELGVIVRGSEGTKLVKERRSQYGTACLTAAWVLGYSSASVISGFLYQYIGFDPIAYFQLIGLFAHVIFRVMYCSSSNSHSNVVVAESNPEEKPKPKPKRLSFPTVTWSYVFIGIFYHSAPVVIWISFANLYQRRFGVGTAISCVVQMAGDFIGSAWVMYKGHLRSSSNNHVTTRGPIQRWIISARKLWCFRTPREISTVLILLGISMMMMCVNNLAVVMIAHVGTGVTYVLLSQSSATGLLVYCQDSNLGARNNAHRVLNSYQMSTTMIMKILCGLSVPFLSEININLPFLISGGLSLIGAVMLAMIFIHRIKTRFHGKGESYMLLSKSIYKLEAEIWDEEDAIRRDRSRSWSSSSCSGSSSSSSIESDDERVTKCMMVGVLEPFVDDENPTHGEVDLDVVNNS